MRTRLLKREKNSTKTQPRKATDVNQPRKQHRPEVQRQETNSGGEGGRGAEAARKKNWRKKPKHSQRGGEHTQKMGGGGLSLRRKDELHRAFIPESAKSGLRKKGVATGGPTLKVLGK